VTILGPIPVEGSARIASCITGIYDKGSGALVTQESLLTDVRTDRPIAKTRSGMLEDLDFVGNGESGAFIASGHTGPSGKLPMNTNGGGLCYTHTGMYGMFAILEAVRQLRGEAAAQVPGIKISFVQGVGLYFAASASLVLSTHRS
jgi:acetyl-CoA acetyltransferase